MIPLDIQPLGEAGVLNIQAKWVGDDRGWFMEGWHSQAYREAGLDLGAAQWNMSFSGRGVLRGLHFQEPNPQGKLVMALQGEVFDVAVDIRRGSPTFGKWWGAVLSSETKNQLWVPPGFAHGFEVLSETALFAYLCTWVYEPENDRGIHWNDPAIGIDWKTESPQTSAKDNNAPSLSAFPHDLLPIYRPATS